MTDAASLARYATAPEPYVLQVSGALDLQPFGTEIAVASDKYDYRLDPASAVPALVGRFSGPQKRIGQPLDRPSGHGAADRPDGRTTTAG